MSGLIMFSSLVLQGFAVCFQPCLTTFQLGDLEPWITRESNEMDNIASKNWKVVVNELQVEDVEETHAVLSEHGNKTDCKQPGLSNLIKWATLGSRHQSHDASRGLKADQFLKDPRPFIEGFRLSLQCRLPRRIWDPGIT
ncbi:hypothetical protein Tco_1128783 [Tanacetum coccineum]